MTSLTIEIPSMKPIAGSLYQVTANLLDGQPLSLSYFKGRVLLIVNTASKCGFTPQYAALEQLYLEFNARGFEVLGFPCDQFGHQEPGGSTQIAEFCERNYGVSFPMFAKVDVNGPYMHPLYRILKAAQPGLFGTQRIKWNFTKFLVDRTGSVVSRHPPSMNPVKLRERIEGLVRQGLGSGH